MNKKATEKILSVYWFAILIIVAGGVFAMVYTFYHQPYDVREIEANLMINKVADCLSKGGKLDSYVIFDQGFSEDFLDTCNLIFDTEQAEWGDIPQYYLQVNFYKTEDEETSVFEIAEGNKNFLSSCDMEGEKLATCAEEEFYSLGDQPYLIKILSIVRKTEKNVKQ